MLDAMNSGNQNHKYLKKKKEIVEWYAKTKKKWSRCNVWKKIAGCYEQILYKKIDEKYIT